MKSSTCRPPRPNAAKIEAACAPRVPLQRGVPGVGRPAEPPAPPMCLLTPPRGAITEREQPPHDDPDARVGNLLPAFLSGTGRLPGERNERSETTTSVVA